MGIRVLKPLTNPGQADYYQRHLFLSILCHALNSKKSSPLDPKYLREEANASESESETEEDSGADNEDQIEDPPEEDTKKTLLRRVTRRGLRRKTRTLDTEASQDNDGRPTLRWSDAMAFWNPVRLG